MDVNRRWGAVFVDPKVKGLVAFDTNFRNGCQKQQKEGHESLIGSTKKEVGGGMTYKDLYTKIGKNTGINPLLLRAIALSLSNERQDAFVCVRGVCKYGLMLLSMPGAQLVGFTGHPENIMEPEINITYAARYLRYLFQQYEYDTKKALVAYLRGRYDSRYIHDAEKILFTWRNLLWQDTPREKKT